MANPKGKAEQADEVIHNNDNSKDNGSELTQDTRLHIERMSMNSLYRGEPGV